MKYLIIHSYLQKPNLQLRQNYKIVNSLREVKSILNGYNNEETKDTFPIELFVFKVDKPIINYCKESSMSMQINIK